MTVGKLVVVQHSTIVALENQTALLIRNTELRCQLYELETDMAIVREAKLAEALRATIHALEAETANLVERGYGSESRIATLWALCNGYEGSVDARAVLAEYDEEVNKK